MSEPILKEFPKVLVINGEPFWQGSATGITMSNLFKSWPKEKLACLYTSDINPDQAFCIKYWRLTLKDLQSINWLFGYRNSEEANGKISISNSLKFPLKEPNQDSEIPTFIKQMRMMVSGQSVRELDTYHIPKNIINEISEFNPQIIYSMLASNMLMQLVLKISNHFNIPVVPHFMDDWPTFLYKKSIFKMILRRVMHSRIIEILEKSPKRLVIGHAMSKEYSNRYGGEFIPFMNVVDSKLLRQPLIKCKQRKKLQLIHIGSLHLNRWRSLLDIAYALKKLGEEGIDAELLVYSQSRYAHLGRRLNISPVIRYVGTLPMEKVPLILRNADILIYVDGFDKYSRTYLRYSISTKIPEYMSAARPIFAYGPEELASIRYIKETGTGMIVGTRDLINLVTTLRKLCSSRSLRNALGVKGFQIANQEHNAFVQREKFRTVLQFAVGDIT